MKALEAVKAAIGRAFGQSTPDPRIVRGDDLRTAFARQFGVPILERPTTDPLDVEHVKPNRADRRRRRSGSSIRVNRGTDYTPRTSPRAAPYSDAPRLDVLARRAARAGRADVADALDQARTTGAIHLTRKDTP